MEERHSQDLLKILHTFGPGEVLRTTAVFLQGASLALDDCGEADLAREMEQIRREAQELAVRAQAVEMMMDIVGGTKAEENNR